MRDLPSAMAAILAEGGPFVGDRKPVTRITVEPDWWLGQSSGPVGNRAADKLPIRWWQRNDNSQVEVEVPNLKQVIIDRQISQQCATISVQIYNTITPPNGQAGPNADAFGDPGHYAYAYGSAPDAQARWNQTPNAWANVLREGALLRVYQGYGGFVTDSDGSLSYMALNDAIDQGYLILNGVFLVDECQIDAGGQGSGGLITLTGRDMGKLLVEQIAWPPTVPQAFYTSAGIQYWVTGQKTIETPPATPRYGTGAYTSTRAYFYDFSGGIGMTPILGHNPADACDNNDETFYISEGFDDPNPSSPPWIEFGCDGQVDSVLINPWGGNFMCYVSIYAGGGWASGEGSLNGVPYVTHFGVPANVARWNIFPKRYNATKVRLTFLNLQYTPWSPNYRVGLREVKLGVTGFLTQADREIVDVSWAPGDAGYRFYGSDGKVYNYGNSAYYGDPSNYSLDAGVVAGAGTASGRGYWMCCANGGVFAYGDAINYGGANGFVLDAPIVAFRITPSEQGYYMCAGDGGVFAFGDAQYLGGHPPALSGNIVDFAVTPKNDGYWMVDEGGNVYTFGNAVNYGSLSNEPNNPIPDGDVAVGIEPTIDGGGYWIVTFRGAVFNFGNAPYHGQVENEIGHYSNGSPVQLDAPIAKLRRTNAGGGYIILANDGGAFVTSEDGDYGNVNGFYPGIGTFPAHGFGYAPWYGCLRGDFFFNEPGNYADYADIITDFLLWAGFWLYPSTTNGTVAGNDPPYVFGNIESTGCYNALGPLPPATWDKNTLSACIQAICQIVGYYCRIDETGAARFQPYNFWSPGNFFDDGTATSTMIVLDEKTNLLGYTQTTSDQSTVSEIIVGSQDPYIFGGNPSDSAVIRFTPGGIGNLHGINKPAMIAIPMNVPISVDDEEIMAELLAVQCYMANRQGQAVAYLNPAICVDDQIRIMERSTGEANIHYVAGVHVEHDLDQGTCIATYTTYWLGNSSAWVINAEQNTLLAGSQSSETVYDVNGIVISQALINFLANTGAKATRQLVGKATQYAPGLAPSSPGASTVAV